MMDEQRYAEAGIIAEQAHETYPSALTECMVEKAAFAKQWMCNQRSAPGGEGFVCGIPEDSDANGDDDCNWHLGDLKKWEELTSAKDHN